LFVAAFFPHVLDVTQRREILVGDALNDETTALRFPFQPTRRHAAVGKRNFSGTL
jgi:hypothetical protein